MWSVWPQMLVLLLADYLTSRYCHCCDSCYGCTLWIPLDTGITVIVSDVVQVVLVKLIIMWFMPMLMWLLWLLMLVLLVADYKASQFWYCGECCYCYCTVHFSQKAGITEIVSGVVQLFEARRSPEGTLWRPKRRVEDQRAQAQKKRPPGVEKYGFISGICGLFRKHQITPVKYKAKSTLENRVFKKWEGRKVELPL